MLFFTETCTHFLIKSPFLAENAILEKHKIFWKALMAYRLDPARFSNPLAEAPLRFRTRN